MYVSQDEVEQEEEKKREEKNPMLKFLQFFAEMLGMEAFSGSQATNAASPASSNRQRPATASGAQPATLHTNSPEQANGEKALFYVKSPADIADELNRTGGRLAEMQQENQQGYNRMMGYTNNGDYFPHEDVDHTTGTRAAPDARGVRSPLADSRAYFRSMATQEGRAKILDHSYGINADTAENARIVNMSMSDGTLYQFRGTANEDGTVTLNEGRAVVKDKKYPDAVALIAAEWQSLGEEITLPKTKDGGNRHGAETQQLYDNIQYKAMLGTLFKKEGEQVSLDLAKGIALATDGHKTTMLPTGLPQQVEKGSRQPTVNT